MSDWIEWKGGECPVPTGVWVQALHRDGRFSLFRAEAGTWPHTGSDDDIMSYVTHRPDEPSAGDRIAALEQQVKTLREALFRLKTECEVDGLQSRAGFDAWISLANEALAATEDSTNG